MCDSKPAMMHPVAVLLVAGLFGTGFCMPSSLHQQPRQLVSSPPLEQYPVAPHVPCAVDVIASILTDHIEVNVTSAETVPAGGSFRGSSGLPALCAVQVNVKSSPTSEYNFGLLLPDSTWNQRFMVTGNGGYSGGIQWGGIARLSKYGFASMSTDTGHESDAGDGSWGLDRPESLYDWGYRAMHGSIVLAKEIVAGYYTDELKYSYYSSCSTGGRQGLKEVQLHPESFDGILVGAPAWWSTHLASSTLWQGLYNFPDTDSKHIPPELFSLIVAEQVKQCDPQDGLTDGIISDPYACNFNFEALLCTSPEQSSSCLTPTQVGSLYKFYSDWIDENQTLVFPGVSIGASPGFLMSAVSTLGSGYYQYWVYNDTDWDYTKFSYNDVKVADRIDPGNATADDFEAIGRYNDKGGKILMYHGDADSLIPTKSSTYFYKMVQQQLAPKGVKLDDFFRLFLVPGMDHCRGSAFGDAPWYFGAGGQSLQPDGTYSVPGFEDADHDAIFSLMRWVEGGKAPDQLIASKFQNDSSTGAVIKQRPLCVYPKQARYDGGDPNSAASFSCRLLY